MKHLRPSEKIVEFPNETLNIVLKRLRLKNDAALARELDIAPPVLSKIRHKKLPLGCTLLLRMLEATDLSTCELYALLTKTATSSAPEPKAITSKENKNRKSHDVSTYGIYRRNHQQRETHSASWHVSLQRAGVKYDKVFCDSRYGGADEAFLAAQRFRDEILRNVPPLARAKKAQMVKSNCTSGIPGVSRVNRLYSHKDGPYRMIMWQAQVQLSPGKVKSRMFSVKKYGEQRAFELAVQARQHLLEEMDGYVLHTPASQLLQAQIENAPLKGNLSEK